MNFALNQDGVTPLMMACQYEAHEIIDLILSNPTTQINMMDIQGANAVHKAVCYGHLEIMQKLLRSGGLCIPTIKGATVLHIAVKKGFIEIVKFLLMNREQININIIARKNNGMTAAMMAARHNHMYIFHLLQQSGADLFIRLPKSGVDILYLAAE